MILFFTTRNTWKSKALMITWFGFSLFLLAFAIWEATLPTDPAVAARIAATRNPLFPWILAIPPAGIGLLAFRMYKKNVKKDEIAVKYVKENPPVQQAVVYTELLKADLIDVILFLEKIRNRIDMPNLYWKKANLIKIINSASHEALKGPKGIFSVNHKAFVACRNAFIGELVDDDDGLSFNIIELLGREFCHARLETTIEELKAQQLGENIYV